MIRFLILGFVTVFFSACLQAPGTNTGNPDAPVNTSPVTDVGTKYLNAVALEICIQRQRCFDIPQGGCVEMIWSLPRGAEVFDVYQHASLWSELAQLIDKSELKINQSEAIGCFDQLKSVDCQDPVVDQALNRQAFNYAQLIDFFNTTPRCRAIVKP